MTDVLGKGKKNKVRVYYLAWLRNKILHNDPEVEKKQGWTTVGEMEGCVHYKVGEYEMIGCLSPRPLLLQETKKNKKWTMNDGVNN